MNKKGRLLIGILTLLFIFSNISCTPASSQEGNTRAAAPDFTLTSLDGENVSLSQFRGKKNVLLVFGTTWCPYCVKEVPELKEIYKNYRDRNVKLLYIDVQESEQKVSSFVKNYSIPYSVLLDIDGVVARDYSVRGIPHQAIIDKDGVILYEGPRPYNGLMSLLSKLNLKE